MEFPNALIFFVENVYKKGFSKCVLYVIIFTNKSLGVFLWSLQNLSQRLNLLVRRKKVFIAKVSLNMRFVPCLQVLF